MPDTDEFRVHAHLTGGRVADLLHALQADGAASRDLGLAAVTHDGDEVFVYPESAATAALVRADVERALTSVGAVGDVTAARWHPIEERWEDLSAPLPSQKEELAVEHARQIASEDARSAQIGMPEWEVRITLASHHDARELAARLHDEGIPVLRRWRHLAVGADDEDQARALAERLRAEAPPGSALVAEPSAAEAWLAYRRAQSRYAMFGGLGG